MSTLTAPLHGTPPRLAPGPPRAKRWTVDEFHWLWENNRFEGTKPMLLDGEIVVTAIPGPPHDQGIGLADYSLKSVFQSGYWVRVQQSLPLGLWSDPVPDIAVVRGSPRDYSSLPKSALLVVEISDTSLDSDIGRKAVLYATAQIQDYWVVDLNGRQLIVFCNPVADPESPGRLKYSQVIYHDEAESVSSLVMPDRPISVADLLP